MDMLTSLIGSKKLSSQYKVRTSVQDRTLDSWMPITQNNPSGEETAPLARTKEIKETVCRLTTVSGLRAEVLQNRHSSRRSFHLLLQIPDPLVCTALTDIIEKHTFVGIADYGRCLSLVQYETKLYLVNHAALAYVSSLWIRWRGLTYSQARNFSIR
jgi:DNA mismatch repair protein MLH1